MSGRRAPAPPPALPTAPPGPVAARFLSAPIRLYQAARAGRPSPCRFWPSCSDYALDALREYGAARGGWMALRRLGRCHPWGGHGVDPVPAVGPQPPFGRTARPGAGR